MKSMYAAVLEKYGHFEWKKVEQPEIEDNEVLILVAYAGICGSDQHIFKGEFHPRSPIPFIPGHEFAGTIVKTGPAVKNFRAGKVGQSILQAVRTKTKNTVILVDILDKRLDLAKRHFPDIYTINDRKEKPVERIKELTGNNGIDIAFEAVGHHSEIQGVVNPVRGCIQSIRGAGTVCVLGLGDEPVPLLMKELIWKQAIIIASRVSQGEFSETIENLEKGTLKPDALITDILNPADIQHGFEMLEKEPENHLKILLKFV